MENNSITSSIHKPVASKGTTTTTKESAGESGWTAYFEDLSNNHFHQPKTYSPSFSCGSSLISDASTTAAAARKIPHDDRHVLACPSKAPNKLRFRETRTKEICEDDSLEDTASSPVNSPKVSNFESNDTNPRKREEDQMHSSMVKEINEEKKMSSDIGMKNNECRELKKRRVFLVALSMLVNGLISSLIPLSPFTNSSFFLLSMCTKFSC